MINDRREADATKNHHHQQQQQIQVALFSRLYLCVFSFFSCAYIKIGLSAVE
jgi:hypothetical protein